MTVVLVAAAGLVGLGILAVVFLRSLKVLSDDHREGWRAVQNAQSSAAQAVSESVQAAATAVGDATAKALNPGVVTDVAKPAVSDELVAEALDAFDDGFEGAIPGYGRGGMAVAGGPDTPPEGDP